MSKFTPGPWKSVEATDSCRHNALRKFCVHCSRPPAEEERQPNSLLMAAAPEMYEALHLVCQAFLLDKADLEAEKNALRYAYDASRAALAKANGGQQ